MTCPECKVNAIKYGITKNKYKVEIQRYYCKYCKKTFIGKEIENINHVFIYNVFDKNVNLEKFFTYLFNNQTKNKDFRNLMQEIVAILLKNNIPLKIIYEMFNKRVSLRTLQRIKKKIITPIPEYINSNYNKFNGKLTLRKESTFKEFYVKNYQVLVREKENKSIPDEKRFEILDKDLIIESFKNTGYDEKEIIDSALTIANLVKLFAKYQENDNMNVNIKSFIEDMKKMYILTPNKKNKAMKLKHKLFIKKVVKKEKNEKS